MWHRRLRARLRQRRASRTRAGLSGGRLNKGPPVCFVADFGKDLLIILKKNVAGLSENALRRFAARAAEAAGLRGKVNVLIAGNRELQALNRRFRSKDQATDVLSFPADPTVAHGLAGDIAISAELATANGERLGHSPAQEVKILVLHGLLHLAGYDHERDHGNMARKEARLRRQLRLPVGLIERQLPSDGSTRQQERRQRSRGRLR